jgi:predicted PurR-regulated permease PerM
MNFTTLANQSFTSNISDSQSIPELQWPASSILNGIKSIKDYFGSFLNTTSSFFNSISTYAQGAWTSTKVVLGQIGIYSLITIACLLAFVCFCFILYFICILLTKLVRYLRKRTKNNFQTVRRQEVFVDFLSQSEQYYICH